MRSWKLLTLPTLAAAAFWVSTPTSPAQVSINIGPAPVCPYGYYDYPPYECALPTAITVQSGSAEVCSSEPDHGSMARTTSTAM